MTKGATQSLGPDTCKDAPRGATRRVDCEMPSRLEGVAVPASLSVSYWEGEGVGGGGGRWDDGAALALRLAVASW